MTKWVAYAAWTILVFGTCACDKRTSAHNTSASPQSSRNEADPDINNDECEAELSRHDPAADARAHAKEGRHPFFGAELPDNVGLYAPGLICGSMHFDGGGFIDKYEALAAENPASACAAAIYHYKAKYNRAMAAAYPNSLALNCSGGSGRIDPTFK